MQGLGLDVRFVGALGDDSFGEMLTRHVEAQGFSMRYMKIFKAHRVDGALTKACTGGICQRRDGLHSWPPKCAQGHTLLDAGFLGRFSESESPHGRCPQKSAELVLGGGGLLRLR